MCRCINADHVIGTAFLALLEQGVANAEISLTDLIALEKALDRALRERNNTIVDMSLSDVYDTVDNYDGIFEIVQDNMRFRASEVREPQELTDILYSCFRAGLPPDIGETVDREVMAHLGVGVRGEE